MQQDSTFIIGDNHSFDDSCSFFENFICLQDEFHFPVLEKDSTISLDSNYIFQKKINEFKQESLFVSHELKVVEFKNQTRNNIRYDWMSAILILCTILLIVARKLNYKKFNQIFQSFFSIRFFNHTIREGNILKERISTTFFIIYTLSFSLFIIHINRLLIKSSLLEKSSFYEYCQVFLVINVLFFLKIIILKIIGNIFQTKEITSNYILNSFLSKAVWGLVLIPVLIISIYFNELFVVYIGLGLLSVLLVNRGVRGIIIGADNRKFSILYYFLYLCTLEILPVVLLIKTIHMFYI